MKLSNLFNEKKMVYSFEVFPPNINSDISTIYSTLDGLKDLKPDYLSVTYSAGGGSNNARSIEIASLIKNQYGIEPLAHLTCINSTKEQTLNVVKQLKEKGIENILALRGDRVPGSTCTDFAHASDLVTFIKNAGMDFDFAGACYPEGHTEAVSIDEDIENLKKKIDAGVTHLNTQLFFDNEDFYRFIDKVRAAGITVPIQAGIMPVVKQTTITRTIAMTGAKVPSKLSRMIARFAENPEGLIEAGVLYAVDQIADIVNSGACQGVHVYVMNNAVVAKRITDDVVGLIDGVNNRQW